MTKYLKNLWVEEQGQHLPEYALLLVLLSLTAVSTLGSVAVKVNNMYSDASTHVAAANHPGLTGSSDIFGSTAPVQTPLESKKHEKPTPVDPAH